MAKRSRIKIDFNFSSIELRGGRRDSKRRRSCVLSRPGCDGNSWAGGRDCVHSQSVSGAGGERIGLTGEDVSHSLPSLV